MGVEPNRRIYHTTIARAQKPVKNRKYKRGLREAVKAQTESYTTGCRRLMISLTDRYEMKYSHCNPKNTLFKYEFNFNPARYFFRMYVDLRLVHTNFSDASVKLVGCNCNLM